MAKQDPLTKEIKDEERRQRFLWWKYAIYGSYIAIGLIIPIIIENKDLFLLYHIVIVGIFGTLFCIQNKKHFALEVFLFSLFNGLFLFSYISYLFCSFDSWTVYFLRGTTALLCILSLWWGIKLRLKNNKSSYLSIAWRGFAVFAIIMITFPIIMNKYGHPISSNEKTELPSTPQPIGKLNHIDYIALVISCCSCTAVAVTLALQGMQLKSNQEIQQQTYDYQILELIDQFSPEVKAQCTELKEILQNRTSPLYDRTVYDIKYAFERQLRDDYYSDIQYQYFREYNKNYQYYVAFTKFIRHFEKFSLYELNDKTGKALHFYYVWWKPFLTEMIGYFLEVKEMVEKDSGDSLILPGWVHLCKTMDRKFRALEVKDPQIFDPKNEKG